MEIKFPFIIDGSVVFLELGKDELPPQGSGIEHTTYGFNYQMH